MKIAAYTVGITLGVAAWLKFGPVVALLIVAIAFLWTIAEELQSIRAILRIAHASALREHYEEEIESRHFPNGL